MPLSFTLWYAAPETIIAFKAGQEMCTASEAVDLFAFGVLCYELLTGVPYYPLDTTTSGAGQMLAGLAPLPHEVVGARAELGSLDGYAAALSRDLDWLARAVSGLSE